MREHLSARLRECGLELHPEKTRVVYCKDSNRTRNYEPVQFDFLGYTFRPRGAWTRFDRLFTSFSPAMSRSAMTEIRQTIRGWRLPLKSELSLEELARQTAPMIRGWIGYYCRFYRSAFGVVSNHLNRALVRWAMRKYKRLRGHPRRAKEWLAKKKASQPNLFPHGISEGGFAVGTMGAR